jgi:hypothetical protein
MKVDKKKVMKNTRNHGKGKRENLTSLPPTFLLVAHGKVTLYYTSLKSVYVIPLCDVLAF